MASYDRHDRVPLPVLLLFPSSSLPPLSPSFYPPSILFLFLEVYSFWIVHFSLPFLCLGLAYCSMHRLDSPRDTNIPDTFFALFQAATTYPT